MAVYDPSDARWSSDPWPGYAELRESAPVQRSDRGFWVLARHEDCLRVLRDRSASADDSNIDPALAPVDLGGAPEADGPMGALEQAERDNRPFLFLDPPDHTRLRGLVARAFTPRMVEGLRARTEQIVDALVTEALERGEIDAVADFAYPLPVRIICDMLGVPPEDEERFSGWSAALARGLDPDFLLPADVRVARSGALLSFAEYFFELLAERRKAPGSDLLSQLVAAEDESGRLTEGELLSTAILLLVAGHETTVNLISGGLLALLRHPDQLERLRHEPDVERSAVEELLRYVSPVQLTGRVLTDPMTLAGADLPPGVLVMLLIGSANHDAEVFDEPDRLDLGRADNRHLGFGFGIHHCLGAPLARLETQVALPTLLRRTRSIELASDVVTYRRNVVLRGLVELPVRMTAA